MLSYETCLRLKPYIDQTLFMGSFYYPVGQNYFHCSKNGDEPSYSFIKIPSEQDLRDALTVEEYVDWRWHENELWNIVDIKDEQNLKNTYYLRLAEYVIKVRGGNAT